MLHHRIGDLEIEARKAVIKDLLHHRIGDLENEEIFNHYHKTLHHRIGDLETVAPFYGKRMYASSPHR